MTSHKKAISITTALIAAGTVLAFSGCAPATSTTAATDSLAVVATTTQVADFSREVAGTAGTVTGLVQANQSVHGFDPSAKNLLDLGAADVLVTSGVDLESWLDDAIAASGFAGTVIDASTGVTLLPSLEASGAMDPHVWTNPANAVQMVQNIAAGFVAADPAQAIAFEANSAAYVEKLTALNAWATASIDQVPLAERLLVTNHDAFTYFYNAYGITFVGSIIPSLDDNAEPSAAELDTLIAAIQASGAKAVFSEASLSPKLAETIAQEAGVQVYSVENALYSDSLGAAGSPGATYLSATIHNVTVLMDSWGYAVTPLPATLAV
ncbi:metal ABC transporter substrate-binding protein [Alpinimonas psychrophila]|uniref:Zinc/manganese transport system substrate-binding protein/manganese/iron transport system substrate-binding protein n=1 Tax=Alpinimonas psychrophila TaxID=748908 RepID=A0A7W3JUC3_9MICO|nr:zinc ABC transporter substrate-binding protein [Alpinimonas psychrophila]MBA8829423.1 zinc/manganese transport system substrate-binding protein/manganese/iron transport system substrate-binding protein [Alpinimonas psychrophila]